jgi:hypothetical protein
MRETTPDTPGRMVGIMKPTAILGVGAFAATLTLFASAGAASAATPVVQACVGSTFSSLAQAPGPLGQGVRTFAQDPSNRPGLGDGIQALQAGVVPQDVVANACNTSS